MESLVTSMQGISLGAIFAFRRALDGSFTFPYTSPLFDRIYSVSRSNLAQNASAVLRLLHPDDLDRLFASLAESEESLSEWKCEFRIKTPVKGEMWVEGRAVPRREADGSVLWLGYVNGATGRRQAKFAVRESEKKFRTYFENSPIAIMIVNQQGQIIDCNTSVQRLLGYDLATVLKMSVFDLHPPEEGEEVRSRLGVVVRRQPDRHRSSLAAQ